MYYLFNYLTKEFITKTYLLSHKTYDCNYHVPFVSFSYSKNVLLVKKNNETRVLPPPNNKLNNCNNNNVDDDNNKAMKKILKTMTKKRRLRKRIYLISELFNGYLQDHYHPPFQFLSLQATIYQSAMRFYHIILPHRGYFI